MSMPDRPKLPIEARLIAGVLGLVVLGFCLWNIGLFRARLELIDYPFGIDHEEEWLVVHLEHLLNGEHYIRPMEESFVVATYHPGMLVATWPLAQTMGMPSMEAGRSIAGAAAVLGALVLALVAGMAARSAPLGLAIGAVWMLSRDTLSWFPYFRVDFLALMLGWLALAMIGVFECWSQRSAGRSAGQGSWEIGLRGFGELLAVVFGVAAFFTKQTMVGPLAAIGIAMLWHSPRRGMFWCVMVALVTGAGMAALEYTSPGSYWFQAITANANVFSTEQLYRWALHFWRFQPVLTSGVLVLAPIAIGVMVVRSVRGTESLYSSTVPSRPLLFGTAVAIYALFGLASFLGSAKLGAAENYMLEPVASLLLLLAWSQGAFAKWLLSHTAANRHQVADPQRSSLSRRRYAVLAIFLQAVPALLLLAHAETMFGSPWFIDKEQRPQVAAVTLGLKSPTTDDYRAAMRASQWVDFAPDATYSERALFTLMKGREPILHPFIMAQLAREGKWNEDELFDRWAEDPPVQVIVTEDLREQAALMGDAQFTPRFKEWLNDGFVLQEIMPGRLFTYYRWIARDGAPEAPSAPRTAVAPDDRASRQPSLRSADSTLAPQDSLTRPERAADRPPVSDEGDPDAGE